MNDETKKEIEAAARAFMGSRDLLVNIDHAKLEGFKAGAAFGWGLRDGEVEKLKKMIDYLRVEIAKMPRLIGEQNGRLAFERNQLREKLAVAVEALKWYDSFEITYKWQGVISPETPFSKYIDGSSEPVAVAREALAKIEGEK